MRKLAREAFSIGELCSAVCCHGNKLFKLAHTHLAESYRKESNINDKNWLRNLLSSYFIKILWVYDVIAWLIYIFYLQFFWNKKYIWKYIVNGVFDLDRKDTIFVIVTLKRNFFLENVLLYFIYFFVIFGDKDMKYKHFIRTPVVFIALW